MPLTWFGPPIAGEPGPVDPAQPAPADTEGTDGRVEAAEAGPRRGQEDARRTSRSTTERAEKTRTEGLATLKHELEIHEAIEEEIFYPALKEHPKTKDLALEGYEEHHVVDTIMGELEGVEPSDETWMAKFSVMKENLEHHIEEEEGEMFPKVEQVFDDERARGAGRPHAGSQGRAEGRRAEAFG